MDELRFRVRDVERWAEAGLISRRQLRNILAEEGLAPEASAAGPLERGLSLVTLLSYFGAFLALTGLSIFVGINWDDVSPWLRALLMASGMVVLSSAGYLLRSGAGFRLGGNLLFLLGMALVPVVVFAVAGAVAGKGGDEFIEEEDLPEAALLMALSLILTAAIAVLSRVPQASLVPSGLLVALAGLAAAWGFGTGESEEIWWTVLGSGGLLVVLSVALRLLQERERGFWVGAVGHLSFYVAITALF